MVPLCSGLKGLKAMTQIPSSISVPWTCFTSFQLEHKYVLVIHQERFDECVPSRHDTVPSSKSQPRDIACSDISSPGHGRSLLGNCWVIGSICQTHQVTIWTAGCIKKIRKNNENRSKKEENIENILFYFKKMKTDKNNV